MEILWSRASKSVSILVILSMMLATLISRDSMFSTCFVQHQSTQNNNIKRKGRVVVFILIRKKRKYFWILKCKIWYDLKQWVRITLSYLFFGYKRIHVTKGFLSLPIQHFCLFIQNDLPNNFNLFQMINTNIILQLQIPNRRHSNKCAMLEKVVGNGNYGGSMEDSTSTEFCHFRPCFSLRVPVMDPASYE